MKYWFAFLLFASAVNMAGKDLFVYPARIPLVAVLGIAGIFCLTAAEVQAKENALKYRRFLVWKQVSYDEIRECQDSFLPGFAYVRLVQFVWPWGRLYFVTARSAFTGNPKELVVNINSRRAGTWIPERTNNSNKSNKGLWLCVIMAFVGLAYSFLWSIFFPAYLRPRYWEGFPPWVAVPMGLWQRAMTWPWAIATIVVLIVVILRLKLKNRAWILAGVSGVLLGNMLIRLIR
jgi:hypothetical protein